MQNSLIVILVVLTTCKAKISPLFDVIAPTADDVAFIPYQAIGLTCTDEMFMYCKAQFNTDLNISTALDWSNVTALEDALAEYYKKDLNSGLFKLCQARAAFQNCFGNFYDACMNRLNFVKHHASNADAFRYVAIFKQLEFECNGGNIQATKNWNCLWNTYESPTYQSGRNECLATYYNTVGNSRNADKICAAGKTLCFCMQSQFILGYKSCARNILDLRWFECERIRTAFSVDGFCPSISCSDMVFGQNRGSFMIDAEVVGAHRKAKMDFYDSISKGSVDGKKRKKRNV